MKNLYLKKIATLTIAATLTMSVAACSSGNNGDKETTAAETTAEAETEAETEAVTEETTSSEITETTTEETTTETTAEEINDPDTSMYEDREVRDWARWYLDHGYYIEYMNHDDAESYWGKGTNVVEGFAAGTDDDNLFTLDYVMKFEDYDSAEHFITELEENGWGPVERNDNGDGTHSYTLGDGIWEATLSANNVLRFVCLDL